MISNHLQVTGGLYQNINMVAIQPSFLLGEIVLEEKVCAGD
jgi:hypothetical protein